jgi:hypothetical protein
MCAALTFAAVMTRESGTWPKDWPADLEPLRSSARTIEVGTGIQQTIYEICFTNREDFERAWPAILKLANPASPGLPGSSVTLYSTNNPPPKDWGSLLRNDKPAVRIYAPTEGYAGGPSSGGATNAEDRMAALKRDIKEGRMLKAGPPWPEDIRSTNGALPEFVSIQEVGGKARWVAADPKKADTAPGFYNRARIDFDVVADGQIIDAQKLHLPAGMPLRKVSGD